MGIDVTFLLDPIASGLDITPERQAALETGGLDEDQVYYQYHTQHDGRVRPSHRALDGTVWRLGDVFAPVPPIDYGCRCYMSYVAKPGTIAARVLPESTAEPTTKAEAFAKHLTETMPDWESLAREAMAKPQQLRFSFLTESLKDEYGMSDARDLAAMILEASATLKKESDNG